MMNHYARNEAWADSVAIAQRFVTKFPAHDQSGAVALKAGQWLTVSGRTAQALAWYTSAEKTFATSDRDMPALLYWHAATMIQGGQVGRQGQRADKIRECLNRVVYDYPRSEYAALARVAMEQIDQQN
jgi:outer membrane protein assembly factor BamD (BamD/ComL family)